MTVSGKLISSYIYLHFITTNLCVSDTITLNSWADYKCIFITKLVKKKQKTIQNHLNYPQVYYNLTFVCSFVAWVGGHT